MEPNLNRKEKKERTKTKRDKKKKNGTHEQIFETQCIDCDPYSGYKIIQICISTCHLFRCRGRKFWKRKEIRSIEIDLIFEGSGLYIKITNLFFYEIKEIIYLVNITRGRQALCLV